MQGGSCTINLMVFGMNKPGREPTTYCMRGGHANYKAIQTRCLRNSTMNFIEIDIRLEAKPHAGFSIECVHQVSLIS